MITAYHPTTCASWHDSHEQSAVKQIGQLRDVTSRILRMSQFFSKTIFYETSISQEIIYAKRLITKIALE